MATLDELFPSKWLKASDLEDGPVVTTIHEANVQMVKGMDGKETKKAVIYFPSKLKPLILNRTNFEACCDISGSDDTDGFVGTKIELYTIETQMGEGIRIREPGGKKKTATATTKKPLPPIEEDLNDSLPDGL
jgi:hypothetical protein